MAVIKGKEQVLKKNLTPVKPTSKKAKKIFSRPQDCQPIPTVAVG